jgi:hypothetical protein
MEYGMLQVRGFSGVLLYSLADCDHIGFPIVGERWGVREVAGVEPPA